MEEIIMKLINIATYILLLSVGTSLLAMEPEQRKSMRVAHLQSQARIDALISPIAKQPSTQRKARKNRASKDPLAHTSSRVRALAREFNNRRQAAQNLSSFSESELAPFELEEGFVPRSQSAPQIGEFMDIINQERDALLQQEEELQNQTPLTPDYSQEYHSAEFDNESIEQMFPENSPSPMIIEAWDQVQLPQASNNSDVELPATQNEKENYCKYTSLMNAAQKGDAQQVEKLLNIPGKRAEINTQNSDKMTALNIAALDGYTDVARLLINAGADLEIESRGGQTPLLWATQYNHSELAKLLISFKANVNAHNEFWITPLMYAVQAGNLEIVKMLLEAGADMHARKYVNSSRHPATAYEMALKLKDETIKNAIIALLDSYGQQIDQE